MIVNSECRIRWILPMKELANLNGESLVKMNRYLTAASDELLRKIQVSRISTMSETFFIVTNE